MSVIITWSLAEHNILDWKDKVSRLIFKYLELINNSFEILFLYIDILLDKYCSSEYKTKNVAVVKIVRNR